MSSAEEMRRLPLPPSGKFEDDAWVLPSVILCRSAVLPRDRERPDATLDKKLPDALSTDLAMFASKAAKVPLSLIEDLRLLLESSTIVQAFVTHS